NKKENKKEKCESQQARFLVKLKTQPLNYFVVMPLGLFLPEVCSQCWIKVPNTRCHWKKYDSSGSNKHDDRSAGRA
ncbi:hypothetical protein N9445_01835, partial [bacterium]|nr:hypothetical protein [bacterium]